VFVKLTVINTLSEVNYITSCALSLMVVLLSIYLFSLMQVVNSGHPSQQVVRLADSLFGNWLCYLLSTLSTVNGR